SYTSNRVASCNPEQRVAKLVPDGEPLSQRLFNNLQRRPFALSNFNARRHKYGVRNRCHLLLPLRFARALTQDAWSLGTSNSLSSVHAAIASARVTFNTPHLSRCLR